MTPIHHADVTVMPHSELYDIDLVRERDCTDHLCMSSSHLLRLPKLTAGSLTVAFTEMKSKILENIFLF